MKIVFCHNVFIRYKTLFDTLKIEKQLFPDSQSVVAYNDIMPPDYVKKFKDVEFIPFHGKSHKIGCANGCITAIKAALKYEPDVIIFSHDDVFINDKYIDVVNMNISKILGWHLDFICRRPAEGYGKNYFMMECFFISKNAAKECFENRPLFQSEEQIPTDIRGSISPEVFLHDAVNMFGVKSLVHNYEHKLEGYNDTLGKIMGFHHLNAGKRGWS